MNRRGLILALLVSLFPAVFLSQEKSDVKPEQIIGLWFDRWNALDGTEQTTNQLLELYRPEAFHQMGPNAKQVGSVRYEGITAIRKMVDDFGKANKDISFKVQAVSANEKSGELLHLTQGSWGGPYVALQYIAAYTGRSDNRRWMYPGAAFFQIQDGKIRGVRFIAARDETMEVFEPPK